MNEKLVTVIAGNRFAELLQRPGSSRVLANVEVQDASRPNLHHHEHIEDAEACRNRDQEVAS